MAAPTKPKPVLEKHYNVKQATVLLGLATEDPDDKRGQKFLRDGVNQEHNPFPCSRMARQLMFTESDLVEIAARHRGRVHGNSGVRRKKRPAARKPQADTALATAA